MMAAPEPAPALDPAVAAFFDGLGEPLAEVKPIPQPAAAITSKAVLTPAAKPAAKPVKASSHLDVNRLLNVKEKPVKASPFAPFALRPVADLLREPSPHQWVLRGYVEANTLILLFSDPAIGKSLLAFDWAACIATDTNWHGCRVKQGPVIVLIGEGYGGFSRRLKAWETENNVSLEGAPFFVSSRRAGLPSETEAVIAAADAAVAEHGVPVVMVIDTLARHIEGDENSPIDMGRFIVACDTLRERYQCAVLVVHHSGHADKGRARAHSSLPGALDASYLLTKDAGGIRELSCVKAKDINPPASMYFRVKPVQLPPPWVDEDGEPLTAPVLESATPTTAKRHKSPTGMNQKLTWNALAEIFKKSGDFRPDGAPSDLPDGRPCLEIEAAILAVKDALTCEPARKAQRAREAIAGLIAGGLLASKVGFIWCA